MTSLPPLNDWNATRDSLHAAAQVVGRIRKLFVPPQPNALHLPLFVTADGLSTGPLSHGEERHEVELNFFSQTIVTTLTDDSGILVNDESLQRLEFQAEILAGKRDAAESPEIEAGRYEINIDPALAADYAGALYRIFTAVARFRSRLLGTMTPVVVWPHHFDLSFLYFTGEGSDEHNDPHMNFGFAPFSDTIDRPYLYFYAWPMPEGLMDKPLPEPARWFDEDWRGVVVDYDKLVGESEPERVIEQVLMGIYELVGPAM